MISSNPMLKKMIATGEEQLGRIASMVIGNPRFVQTLQVAVSRAIDAKGLLDRQVASTLSTLHVPSTQDMNKLNDRLDELERIFESVVEKVDAIADRVDAQDAAK